MKLVAGISKLLILARSVPKNAIFGIFRPNFPFQNDINLQNSSFLLKKTSSALNKNSSFLALKLNKPVAGHYHISEWSKKPGLESFRSDATFWKKLLT